MSVAFTYENHFSVFIEVVTHNEILMKIMVKKQ